MSNIEQLKTALGAVLSGDNFREGFQSFTNILSNTDEAIYHDIIFPARLRTSDVTVSFPSITELGLTATVTHNNGREERILLSDHRSLAIETARAIISTVEAEIYKKEQARQKEIAFTETLK